MSYPKRWYPEKKADVVKTAEKAYKSKVYGKGEKKPSHTEGQLTYIKELEVLSGKKYAGSSWISARDFITSCHRNIKYDRGPVGI